MIFRLISTGIVLLALCGSGSAETNPDARMDTCNHLYHDALYSQAIDCYEGIGTSADILFNIGNSYARMEQPGNAILHYLRALCLAPNDADIQANLDHLRKTYSLYPPAPSFTDRILGALNISQWSYLCIAVLTIYLLFLVVTILRRKNGRSVARATLCCVLLLSLGAAGAWYHYDRWQHSVVVSDTRLLVSPFDKSESVGIISQGRLVSPAQTYHDYVYVTDETGRKGWLHADSFRPIVPTVK